MTPHAWSVPHDTNEHVAGVADALRARGHAVVVLAPSSRSADLLAGRRALADRRPRRGRRRLARGSRLAALRRRDPRRRPRERRHGAPARRLRRRARLRPRCPGARLRGAPRGADDDGRDVRRPRAARLPAPAGTTATGCSRASTGCVATSDDVASAPRRGSPARTRSSPPASTSSGSRRRRSRPCRGDRDVGRGPAGRPLRAARASAPRRLGGDPAAHRAPRGAAVDPARARATASTSAPRFAARRGPSSCARRRSSSRPPTACDGCATRLPPRAARSSSPRASRRSRSSRPPRSCASPRTSEARERDGASRRASVADEGFDTVAERLERLYVEAQGRRRAPRRHETEPLADREWIVADLHMHTNWSHDCSIEPAALVDHAEAEGLGTIAVTDHNVFAGALRDGRARARPRADRDPRRGGQDRPRRRGDRPLPAARRSRAG